MDRAEATGLGIAVAGHAALLAALSLGLLKPPELPKIDVDPVEVELVSDIAPVRTAPKLSPSPPAARQGVEEPEAEPVRPPEPKPMPPVARPPEPAPAPKPVPKPVAKPVPPPKPVAKPTPKPVAPPKPQAKVTAKPQARPSPAAKPAQSKPAAARPASSTATAGNTPRPTGRLNGLLTGVAPASTSGTGTKPAAQAVGPSAADVASIKRALGQEIARQLKPRWKSPTGADVDQLVTILSWDLAKDGSLMGEPRFVDQQGGTPSNQAQARIHRENAIKAVRAAAPFRLPPEHYALWKSVISFKFDKRLSQ